MTKNTHGGARSGAGRPPAIDPIDTPIVTYFRRSEVVAIDGARGDVARGAMIRDLVLRSIGAEAPPGRVRRTVDDKEKKGAVEALMAIYPNGRVQGTTARDGDRMLELIPHGWPAYILAGKGPTWSAALTEAKKVKFSVHRETGWCMPLVGKTKAETFKGDILKVNGGTPTGLDRLLGVHKGIPFEVRVGDVFIEPDDGSDQGVVIAILRRADDLLSVVTSKRGITSESTFYVGQNEVMSEAAFAIASAGWNSRKGRR